MALRVEAWGKKVPIVHKDKGLNHFKSVMVSYQNKRLTKAEQIKAIPKFWIYFFTEKLKHTK